MLNQAKCLPSEPGAVSWDTEEGQTPASSPSASHLVEGNRPVSGSLSRWWGTPERGSPTCPSHYLMECLSRPVLGRVQGTATAPAFQVAMVLQGGWTAEVAHTNSKASEGPPPHQQLLGRASRESDLTLSKGFLQKGLSQRQRAGSWPGQELKGFLAGRGAREGAQRIRGAERRPKRPGGSWGERRQVRAWKLPREGSPRLGWHAGSCHDVRLGDCAVPHPRQLPLQ